jgi:hypothetical protein
MPPHGLVLSSGLVIFAFVLQSTLALAQTMVIRATRMLDVASGEIRKPGVVVIESDRIRVLNPSVVPKSERSSQRRPRDRIG